MPHATLIFQADATVVDCLDDVGGVFGRKAEQLAGKTLSQAGLHFVDRSGAPLEEGQLPPNEIVRSGSYPGEVTIGLLRAAEASPLWLRVQGVPVSDDGGLLRVVTSWQPVAAEREQLLPPGTSSPPYDEWEQTFEAMEDVVTILSPDLRVIRANRAASTTFELSREEIIGRHCYEIFHGRADPCEPCPACHPDLAKSSETGLVYNERFDKTFEVTSSPVLAPDGSLKYLVHSARDITRRLKGEEERNILSAAVKQTGESVLIADVDGSLQYINPAYCRITGYGREELLGKPLNYLDASPAGDELFAEILARLKAGRNWQGTLTTTRKDGSHFSEQATFSPILQNDGQITHFVAVKRDISKEELLQRQLQQAMKMEAIGTLAGGIAHDFNNILAAMIGYGQIAKGRLAQDDPLRDDIEQILLAGDRAANLVKQILTFSRRDTQEHFRPLNVQYIIKEIIRLLRSSIPATIELNQRIAGDCPPILADPGQIHQVIMNLCLNAKQAIGPDYGRLTIRLAEKRVSEPMIIADNTLLTSGRYAHLQVSDNGCGMSREVKERIFDPFFTTKAKEQGTGLGLSVVLGIVEKHGGIITVASALGEGTTFDLYFPAVSETVEATEEAAEVEAMGSERVMLVDDETPLVRLMARILERQGYTTCVYANSLEAVADFRRRPKDIDLVITDMTMPHMTGAELAREVLSLRPQLPVIMTTGFSEVIDAEKAAQIGIRAYMYKPIKAKELVKTVRKVLDDVQNSRD